MMEKSNHDDVAVADWVREEGWRMNGPHRRMVYVSVSKLARMPLVLNALLQVFLGTITGSMQALASPSSCSAMNAQCCSLHQD